MKKILIHVCCAHCLGKTLTGLRETYPNAELAAYWWNFNIHPLIEYRRRLKAVKMFVERSSLSLLVDDEYGLIPFCRAIHGQEEYPARCSICYFHRLLRTAEAARKHQFDRFTSTLVTSTHQNHAQIWTAGEQAETKTGIPFLYHDFRDCVANPKWTHMLYHQPYCGCVFSEYDRFHTTHHHLWPVPPDESRP